MTDSHPLRIGEWRVEPARGEIVRGEDVVRLDPRTLRLLLHLAARPGAVVSIDELLDQVWPGVTVTPDSVYQAVAALRRQLGDDPKQPRYIATVPRLGYRMVAEVSPLPGTAAMPPARRRRWVALAAGCFVAAVAAAAWGALRPAPPASVGVLPVRDETDAMDQEVLVDNLTEDLADGLSHVPGLHTPSPRSSFALKGRHLTAPEAARTLGVTYVLDGNLRKAGAAILLTMRLIRADTGFVTWSQTFRSPPARLSAVENDIVTAVAQKTAPKK